MTHAPNESPRHTKRSIPSGAQSRSEKTAALLREQIAEFPTYVTLEMGKLFKEAQGEVELSADILDYCADNAEAFLAPVKLAVSKGEAYTESAPLSTRGSSGGLEIVSCAPSLAEMEQTLRVRVRQQF
jgi:delta 1-pyrroline-5-carboxylate dehydrogenase